MFEKYFMWPAFLHKFQLMLFLISDCDKHLILTQHISVNFYIVAQININGHCDYHFIRL